MVFSTLLNEIGSLRAKVKPFCGVCKKKCRFFCKVGKQIALVLWNCRMKQSGLGSGCKEIVTVFCKKGWRLSACREKPSALCGWLCKKRAKAKGLLKKICAVGGRYDKGCGATEKMELGCGRHDGNLGMGGEKVDCAWTDALEKGRPIR